MVLDRFRANDEELYERIEEAVTGDLEDIKRDMEGGFRRGRLGALWCVSQS